MEKHASMQNRAYSVIDIKAFDGESRTFSGMATTPSVDRMGDIIEPLGVKFAATIPLLWQHDHRKPIGQVRFGQATENGIPFEADVLDPSTVESDALKERLKEAWDSLKTGLVRAVSIGFRPVEYSFMDTGGIRYTESEVYELSAVTIPANADAVISAVKSIDAALRHEAGVPEPEIPQPEEPAASGKSVRVVKLDQPARDGAKPFVVREIKHTA